MNKPNLVRLVDTLRNCSLVSSCSIAGLLCAILITSCFLREDRRFSLQIVGSVLLPATFVLIAFWSIKRRKKRTPIADRLWNEIDRAYPWVFKLSCSLLAFTLLLSAPIIVWLAGQSIAQIVYSLGFHEQGEQIFKYTPDLLSADHDTTISEIAVFSMSQASDIDTELARANVVAQVYGANSVQTAEIHYRLARFFNYWSFPENSARAVQLSDAALVQYKNSLAIHRHRSDQVRCGKVLCDIAHIEQKRGHPVEARKALLEAVGLSSASADPQLQDEAFVTAEDLGYRNLAIGILFAIEPNPFEFTDNFDPMMCSLLLLATIVSAEIFAVPARALTLGILAVQWRRSLNRASTTQSRMSRLDRLITLQLFRRNLKSADTDSLRLLLLSQHA
jgi:hypothetical protein